MLPVLLSAIRVSPLSEGPAHDGKIIGKDVISYIYKQVWPRFVFNDRLLGFESQRVDVQPVGIPSYLIAIASGNLRYKAFQAIEGRPWKCGVWAEPELLEASYWEFSEDTGRLVSSHVLQQINIYLGQGSSPRKRILLAPTNLAFTTSWFFLPPSPMEAW